MKLSPLGTAVVYRKEDVKKETPSGLSLSEYAFYGRVVAVGPGDAEEPIRVKEGDRVLLYPWTDGKGSMTSPARAIVYLGDGPEPHYVCGQKDVAAVVEG